jgi:hypothetical protein
VRLRCLHRVALTIARRVTILAGLITLALLAAACGTSSGSGLANLPSSLSTTPTTSPSVGRTSSSIESAQEHLLGFTKCVRSHGVPNFSEPGANGLTPSQLSALKAPLGLKLALVACEGDLPHDGTAPTSPLDQTAVLNLTLCMHSHGVSNFPEPGSTTKPATRSIDTGSREFQRATHVCQSLLDSLTSSGASG